MADKSERAEKEEKILQFWKDNKIFEKSLEKKSPKGDFVFYEGPPTANGKPAIHHLEARSFKDAIPRYKTMQGFRVPRKAGWDTHGLPVELEVEKDLGLKSKKEIEEYGIAKFNKACRESVQKVINEWTRFTDRIGYWVNLDEAYFTYNNSYMESVWSILAHVEKRKLLYKGYKVVPWCPRCGTVLSSHELAQGYKDVKDLSLYAKFKIVGFPNAYFLSWTTTPWTLPGNVALAVGKDIDYVEIKVGEEILVLAKERLSIVTEPYEIVAEHKGKDMVGMQYEPLYPFLEGKSEKAFKVYSADFVNTEEGTGIVHTAVMYGQDDFDLGVRVGLPQHHLVDETGHFMQGTEFLTGRFVKDEETAVEIIKDLAHRGLLYKKEKYEHSYPHCWRCKTSLIYYARDSWYIKMSELRNDLVKENKKINWEPEHIKEGRFGEWLREVKDWAISRERYWGTPLPIWQNFDNSKRIVVDSIDTLKKYTKNNGNKYFVMRHGGSESNKEGIISYKNEANDHLTKEGEVQVQKSAKKLKNKKIDVIVSSPFARTRETAEIIAKTVGINPNEILFDRRIQEINPGEYDGKMWPDYHTLMSASGEDWFKRSLGGSESLYECRKRVGECLYEIENKYQGKNILFVTHGGPAWHFYTNAGLFDPTNKQYQPSGEYIFVDNFKYFENAEVRELPFTPLPHNEDFEIDLHRPYIDDIVLVKNGEEYKRTNEVLDVWFDSGSMPFAQDPNKFLYPADFISEAIDQTRGWFYTLHAIGVLMEKGIAYKNVICLGHLLDKDGKKMSKSIGNVVDPWEEFEKHGVDALRFWMYSINQPGESKNFDPAQVTEIVRKVFNLLDNVYTFYELYRDKNLENGQRPLPKNILDRWIIEKLNHLIGENTRYLDDYKLLEPSRNIREFIDDLSTWYVRRSRERIKEGDKGAKQTLYFVLKELSKIMAPLTPLAAEDLYQKLRNDSDMESVHLENWPKSQKIDKKIIEAMLETRRITSLALEARSSANIKVRQPLAELRIKNKELGEEFLELVQDELNVKKVTADESLKDEISLDTTLTPELEEEGRVREEIRNIQDARKEKGLSPGDLMKLNIPEDKKELYQKYKEQITSATNVEFE